MRRAAYSIQTDSKEMVNYMAEPLVFRFDVDGDNFTSAGQASVQVKKSLRELGVDPETIRRVSIAM